MQRWRGTPLAKLQVSTKKEAACAKRWHRFHAKVLDHTMVNLPEHASSDFVAEPSELMLDHAWWDAVGERSTPSCYQSIPLSHSLHRCTLLLLVLQCY